MEGESQLDAADGAAEADGIAAHAFGDDDAFIEIPLLRVGSEQDHELRIFAHAAKAFASAKHEPHVSGLEVDLSFFGFEIVACDGGYTLKLNAL